MQIVTSQPTKENKGTGLLSVFLTFPARPIQGGRLELAPPKRGLWFAEPKLNGWRALIHTPTGTVWNRHGTPLTIAECFRPALAALAKLASRGLVWADCEALERRHNLGRGTLVVLDVIPESGTPIYEQRNKGTGPYRALSPVSDRRRRFRVQGGEREDQGEKEDDFHKASRRSYHSAGLNL